MFRYFAGVTAALLGLAFAGPEADIVYNLPGLDLAGSNTTMWSGYINIPDSSKRIHYLFVESRSDPSTDPVLIWYNGGPGCSSMLAFM